MNFMKKKVDDCLEIIGVLNKKKIDYVVLKGITLEQLDKKRQFSDLDIYVNSNDYRKTINILQNNFNYRLSLNKKEYKFIYGFIEYVTSYTHHIPFEKKNKINIELHRHLADHFFIDKILNPTSRKIFFKRKGTIVPCLIPEIQLLEIILHYSYNHLFGPNILKRWLGDLNLIIKNYRIDWDEFLHITKKIGYLELVYFSFIIINRFNRNKLKVPSKIMKKMGRNHSKYKIWLYEKYVNWNWKKIKTEPNMDFSIKLRCINPMIFSFGLNTQMFYVLLHVLFIKPIGNVLLKTLIVPIGKIKNAIKKNIYRKIALALNFWMVQK